MAGMGDLATILLVGGVGLYALYAYNQGALGTTTGGDLGGTTTFTPGETYTDPTTSDPIPATNATCQQQGGIWQGECCSCPGNNCHNKCGQTDITQRDVCVHERGLWEPNTIWAGRKGCCRCPNIACSDKCGSAEGPSGGVPGTINNDEKLAGVCESEGDDNLWNTAKKCCSCPNRQCQNKCKTTARVPLKDSDSTTGAKQPAKRQNTERPKSTGGGVGGPGKVVPNTPKKSVSTCSSKCAALKNSPSSYKACCAANYATAYLGSAFNRRGPSYTMRDDFRHLPNVENPVPTDFLYEATYRPFYLGNAPHPQRTALRERFDLNANAKSNFTMRFSG